MCFHASYGQVVQQCFEAARKISLAHQRDMRGEFLAVVGDTVFGQGMSELADAEKSASSAVIPAQ